MGEHVCMDTGKIHKPTLPSPFSLPNPKSFNPLLTNAPELNRDAPHGLQQDVQVVGRVVLQPLQLALDGGGG